MTEITLVVEASTPYVSVALVTADVLLIDASVTSHDPVTGARVEGLMPAIATCFKRARVDPTDLSSVICSSGPGGFTSLRSAAAVAKGLCSALHIPLYAVSAMELLVATAKLDSGRYITALDAGRGEYYVSDVDIRDGLVVDITPVTIIGHTQLNTMVHEQASTVVGPGWGINIFPHASAVVGLMSSIIATGPVSIDVWEPNYGRLAEAQVKWEASHGPLLNR